MKKHSAMVLILFALFLAFRIMGFISFQGISSGAENMNNQKKLNLMLNEETAVKIAEPILVHIYGERVRRQIPWKIREENDENGEYYVIEGTFNRPTGSLGGVATIKLRKDNAQVMQYSHGK